MKMIGNIKVIKDPKKMAVPISVMTIPTYIGCLLMRKGPEIIKVLGFICGFTVVFIFLNKVSVHMFMIIPNKINIIPKKV